MANVKERIKREIERKVMKTGRMGSEDVSITLALTDEEKNEFLNGIELADNYSYELDNNELFVTYTEE